MRRKAHRFGNQRGVALIEFALLLPVLITLVAGVFDIGNATQQGIWLYHAVRSAGQMARAYPTDPGGIIEASVRDAMPNWAVTVNAPAMACYCSGGGSVSCTGTCTGGTVQRYIKISASLPFKALIIPLGTLQAAYVERIQ